jgi:hypothetical protein
MFVRHSGAVGKLRRRGIRPAPAERVSFLVGDAETLPLLAASCEPLATEPHDAELRAMGDRVEARLRVARMLAPLGELRAREAAALARMAIEAIAGGSFGDALITACV